MPDQDEITADYAVEQLAPQEPLKVRVEVRVACKTDLGRVRENNEDKFEYFNPEDDATLAARGQIFVVCDGMGGHAAGQIASELAAKTFIDVYLHHPSTDPEVAMRAGVAAAHRYVSDVGATVPSRRGMGTTLSALVLRQGSAWTVQVGDSRIYRLRDGQITQMTEDHTWVDEMVRMGQLSPEEAETHPYKHVLTRAIGGEGPTEPDVALHNLLADDVYLLCSDGLINHVSDARLAEILGVHGVSEACWRLVGEALQNGGSDNCTVLVVRVASISERTN